MAAAECPAAVRLAGLATVLLLLLPGVRAITGESEILERILNPTKYDRNVRPPAENGTGGPVDVKIDLLLRRLLAVSEANMDFTAQLTVVLTWHDPRLRYDDMDTGRRRFVTLTEVSRAWQPDVFFSEEKQGHVHDIVTPNVYMRISPDGLVRFSVRTSMAFACDMDFRRYPMDTQTCTISMQSYGYTEEDLRLSWSDRDEVHFVKQHSSAGLFSIASLQTADCTARARGGAGGGVPGVRPAVPAAGAAGGPGGGETAAAAAGGGAQPGGRHQLLLRHEAAVAGGGRGARPLGGRGGGGGRGRGEPLGGRLAARLAGLPGGRRPPRHRLPRRLPRRLRALQPHLLGRRAQLAASRRAALPRAAILPTTHVSHLRDRAPETSQPVPRQYKDEAPETSQPVPRQYKDEVSNHGKQISLGSG
ncbi:uncharacterized protein LOC124775162 [Schistocerca piceifrons]|uniref:uncharacterized protein LOC124775162 n=1 Tax=Schistocerca piceifrons TaxID=274613 RepID=UPI001F5FDEED|nr:uncharacterized protein LOC124775162 [Schistocerca piceifrons]